MNADIDMRSVLKSAMTMEVKVKHRRDAILRVQIALCLIRLAAWIAGFGIQVTHEMVGGAIRKERTNAGANQYSN